MRLFVFISLLLIVSCHPAAKKNVILQQDTSNIATAEQDSLDSKYHFGDPKLEEEILDTIGKIPFIVTSNKYIDSFSHHKHGIAFLMDTIDEDGEKSIHVNAGYNGPERFENYYHLYVYFKPFEITVLNVDSEVTVDDYIKQNK